MTGKEALRILEKVIKIRDHLLDEEDKEAFYCIGLLCEFLGNMVKIDEVSLNPTVSKEDEEG